MLTFRRAFMAAALFLTIFYLTTRSTSTSSPAPAPQIPKANLETTKQTSSTTASPDHKTSDGHPALAGAGRNRENTGAQGQQPIRDMSKMTLYEKLAYQYPYDVQSKFPAYIWQTWKWTPAHGEFNFREQEASWTEQHPGFIHEVITDQVAVHLLRLLYASVPEVLEAYEALPLPVLKADFFRYLILLARGGIYSDIDTYAIRSALDWIPEKVPRDAIGLVIGIEADPDRPDWKDWYSRRIQFCQWTIQAKPGHPVLREVVTHITNETLRRKRSGALKDVIDKNVIEFTGPAVWTDIIFDYFNDQRYFDMSKSAGPIDWRNFTGMEVSKRVGDVVVLPITSFSPGVQQMGAKDYEDPMAFVKHDFEGTWKPESERHIGPPLLPHTTPEHFASVVSRYGDRPAVICRSPTTILKGTLGGIPLDQIPAAVETTYTYEKLDHVSNVLAHSLRSLGVKKGDRVAVSLGNCPEFAALTYAIFKLGAILVPLNPGFNSKQVAAALNHLEVRLLIIGAVTDLTYKPCRGRSNLALLQEIVPDLASGRIESPNVPSLSTVVVVDNTPSHPLSGFPPLGSLPSLTPFTTLTQDTSTTTAQRPITPDAPLSPSETINIQFTSGTTSQPKAAMLTHTNILNNGYLIAQRMGLTPSDLIVCPPPLFHCFGCVLGYMATATTGAGILFPSPAFDPLASLRMVADHKATGLYGIAAGSSVPESLMRRIYETLGLEELVICYGMTETSPVSCMTAPQDPFEKRTGSVGKVMPHTRVKVVDAMDRNKILPVGEKGELAAAGYLVMQGYWGDEERTGEVRIWEKDHDDDGGRETVWMYSGDEASMDEDGYVEITGRIKDLIIRGGENIHPLEIENCLFQHPLIAEASVVGVACSKYGEEVGAFVVVHKDVAVEGREGTTTTGKKVLTKEEVRNWVRTHLSKHLAPKYVFWIDEYPKTASGKIQKFKLRELARKLVGEDGGVVNGEVAR
ncbi:hypothetical protein V8F33_001131 [Rhypophila sp. PSN 637]